MLYETKISKNIKQCGVNLKDKIEDADSWSEAGQILMSPWWLTGEKCEY